MSSYILVHNLISFNFVRRENAKDYYEKAHDIEGLMDSLYHLEHFDDLENCINKLPEKSASLGKLGQM